MVDYSIINTPLQVQALKLNKLDAIGVFDSGVGGLNVVSQIMQCMKNENIVYFGDIARVPYGTKSISMIRKFTTQTVQFLLTQKVKAIVIACNTISAIAKDVVLELSEQIPVFDVISSGVSDALNSTITQKIGVLATPATIESKAYQIAIQRINPRTKVNSIACPLLVPFIEEGIFKHQALEIILQEYLDQLDEIDTLILGCTHYPIIIPQIQKIIKSGIRLINPAIFLSQTLKQFLQTNNLLNNQHDKDRFFVTDLPHKFHHIAEMLLTKKINHLELINFE